MASFCSAHPSPHQRQIGRWAVQRSSSNLIATAGGSSFANATLYEMASSNELVCNSVSGYNVTRGTGILEGIRLDCLGGLNLVWAKVNLLSACYTRGSLIETSLHSSTPMLYILGAHALESRRPLQSASDSLEGGVRPRWCSGGRSCPPCQCVSTKDA